MKTCIEGRKCEKTQEEDPCFTHSKPTEKSKTCQTNSTGSKLTQVLMGGSAATHCRRWM